MSGEPRMASYRLTLEVRGPLLVKSSSPGSPGIDALCHRDPQGRLVVPASSLAGRLREAWQQLSAVLAVEADDATSTIGRSDFDGRVQHWLGPPPPRDDEVGGSPDDGDARNPWRGIPSHRRRKRLVLPDLLATDGGVAAQPAATRTRIAIDAASGTALDGAFQVIEQPFPTGAIVTLQGEARALVGGDEEAASLERTLRAALRWLPCLGGLRSAGAGRVQAADVCLLPRVSATAERTSAPPRAAGDGRVWLVLRFDRPICVTDRRRAGNYFESSSVVPGSVLKGAIADHWARLHGAAGDIDEEFDDGRPLLARHFSNLGVGHALPVPRSDEFPRRRPVVPPLSLGVAAGRFADLAHSGAEPLIDGRAPAFSIDWKGDVRGQVDKAYGWAWPASELRVRTAIDAEARRAAVKRLFAYECKDNAHHDWIAPLDLHRVDEPERDALLRELADLLGDGLFSLGKTKAGATVSWLRSDEVSPVVAESVPRDARCRVVTLQTDALLGGADWPGEGSDAATMQAFYAAAWHDLSGGRLALVEDRYFARQRLHGGTHVAETSFAGRPYEPFLLTEAGSVFVVAPGPGAGSADEAWQCLSRLRAEGLPLTPVVREHYGIDEPAWRRCPFVPENGFGAIALDLPLPDFAAAARVEGAA